MKKSLIIGLGIIFMTLFSLWGTSEILAYEEIDVSNGGSISGTITIEGQIPKPRVFTLAQFPFGPFCKKISDGEGNVRLKEYIVHKKNNGLWEAVVSIKSIDKGKPYRPTIADFVAVDCMFHPADVADDEQFVLGDDGKLRHQHPNVAILHNNQRLNMINRDPVVHNIQVYQNEKGNIILNSPLPISDQPRGGVLNFKRGRRISQMICGMHEFMQSWGFVVRNPYYAKTEKDGSYKIDGIPPGTYEVSIWHPHSKIYNKTVTVKANKESRMDFVFNASLIKRPLYESQEQTRLDTATPKDHILQEGDERILIGGE